MTLENVEEWSDSDGNVPHHPCTTDINTDSLKESLYKSIYIQSFLEADDSSLWAPVLKNYRVDEFISQGAFGSVFKATCLRKRQTVAIKMIGNFGEHEYHSLQILREIQLMKALNAMPGGTRHVP